MQRTVVLYAFAACTLAGALLLVIPAPPPPAIPTPPTNQNVDRPPQDPVTRLSYANGTLAVTADLDRGRLLAGEDDESIWMDISVRAVAQRATAPLSIVLVIDRSGSMAGEKIDNVRLAAHRVIKRLKPQDQLGIISYGTDTTVDLPLTYLDPASERRAFDVIEQLEEGGGTNIDGGLRAAATMLTDTAIAHRIARVILLSDGQATEGERRISQLAQHGSTLRHRGIGLSTIGVGLDYHEDLMERLAVDGGGRYHYLKRSSMLGSILSDELKHASQIVAHNVTLHFPARLEGYRVAAAPGQRLEFGEKWMGPGQGTFFSIGSLASGEIRRVLIRLEPTADRNEALNDGQLQLAAPTVNYIATNRPSPGPHLVPPGTFLLKKALSTTEVDQSRQAGVRARVLEVEASLALSEAMSTYARYERSDAVRRLNSNIASLESMAKQMPNEVLQREATNLRRVVKQMQQAAPSSSVGADLIKAEKARAYHLRR